MDKKIFALLVLVLITFTFVQYSFCQVVVADTVVNEQSKIILTPINAGGNDASLRDLQKSAGYKVEIIDDSPEKLDVDFSGPVTIKQISATVFEITLALLNSEDAFDKWIKSKDAPYLVSFTVKVKNVNTKNLINSQVGIFTFGKW